MNNGRQSSGSDRAQAQAQGSRRTATTTTTRTSDSECPSPPRAGTSLNNAREQQQQQPGLSPSYQQQQRRRQRQYHQDELVADGSFADERFGSSTAAGGAASWEEAPSFESIVSEELQQQQQSRSRISSSSSSSSSRNNTASRKDRRKQFDTTTPTLIDEEDVENEEEEDSEMLQLQTSFERQQLGKSQEDASASEIMRRTPGASSMYQSNYSHESSSEEFADNNMRRTPGASAMHRSAADPPPPASSAASTTASENKIAASGGVVVAKTGKENPTGNNTTTSAMGLGFSLTLSHHPVGVDESTTASMSPAGRGQNHHHHHEQQKQTPGSRIAWESYETSSQPSYEEDSSNRPRLVTSTSTPDRQHPEPRGPFSFAPWARSKSPGGSGRDGGSGRRRSSSGAFSPNILKLTEDIVGNLLQEDEEDDDYALDIPGVFRGSGETNASSSATTTAGVVGADIDWTGSYVYDSQHRKKPAVPLRSAPGAEKSSRRRLDRQQHQDQQQQHQGSGLLSNAQHPIPRRNEVFEFGGRPSSRTTPQDPGPRQPLIFGGAFAPPGLGLNSGFARPDVSLRGSDSGSVHQQGSVSPFFAASDYEPNRPRVGSVPGHQVQNLQQLQQIPSQGSGAMRLREHAQSFDSYQSAQQPGGPPGGGYGQQEMYSSASPVYGIPSYASQQSEMQATARVFVPQSTRSTTPQYQGPPPPSQQPWQPIPGRQFDPPLAQSGSWQSSYNFSGSNFQYSVQSQPSFGDPRAGMTPSPHLQQWQQQQQQQQQQPPPPSQVSMQHSLDRPGIYSGIVQRPMSEMGTAVSQIAATPSQEAAAVPEQAASIAQRGGKKETRRTKRGRKKTQKNEGAGGAGKKGLTISKRKGKGETARSGTSVDGNDEVQPSASEDPVDPKRSELNETPATRIAFKEFYRTFRSEERISFQKAEEFALSALEDDSLPESVHWRVYLELADLAKRSNRYAEARCLYQKVCQLQPYASQGWLEYSKLEEECGNMNRVMNILHKGLNYCEFSENLLSRAVKHQEKMGNLANARGLLARLKHAGIEKVWRTVLEGALLEARAGNTATARRVLKYLMHHVPWYGPLYLEAYRLEKDQGHPLDALHVVERGLQAIPRYGPLWFGAFRLCEEMDIEKKLYHLPTTMDMIERASVSISKELVWKVHLEAAQMLERASVEQASFSEETVDVLLYSARRRISMTVLTCPNNLRWKVWLAAGRMELGVGNTERARSLFRRAHEVVPKKGRSATLLECARLEAFVGDTELSRAILCKGRAHYGNDWKVWLESVLSEIRDSQFKRAMEICDVALEMHQGTGRLWATLVHLRQYQGRDQAQLVTLKRALNAVPKSGEVWCEGGRIHLNPFSDSFDLKRARRHLHFATRFTPQYGDGFIETIRLEIVRQWLSPVATFIWEKTKDSFQPEEGGAIDDCLTKYITDVSLALTVASQDKLEASTLPKLIHREIVTVVRERLELDAHKSSIELNSIRLACVNADPNYGSVWFHCRRKSTDTPRRLIEDAAGLIASELRTYAHFYLAAMLRRKAVLSVFEETKAPALDDDEIETSSPDAVKWEDFVDAQLHAAPSLEDIFNPKDPTTGTALLESPVSGPIFSTGLTGLNQNLAAEDMSLIDRRRALFGNDALFP